MLYRAALIALAASADALSIGVGDKFPAPGLSKLGCSGKKSVIFFYGADDAPSCSKQIMAMDQALPEFQSMGVKVVGVRNAAGVKLDDDPDRLKLVVDEDDELRNELEIPKDFIFLGGRQSYVVDASGTITCVHNNQFDTDSHVTTTLEAAAELPAGGSSPFDGIELPKFELPDFSSFFGGAKEEEEDLYE